MMPTTKKEARLSNEPFFYTGRPCIDGHLSKRYASTGNCVECHKKPSPFGIKSIRLEAYPEDVDALEECARLLREQREYERRRPPTREEKYARWMRAHGETVARQMLEMEDAATPNQTPAIAPGL